MPRPVIPRSSLFPLLDEQNLSRQALLSLGAGSITSVVLAQARDDLQIGYYGDTSQRHPAASRRARTVQLPGALARAVHTGAIPLPDFWLQGHRSRHHSPFNVSRYQIQQGLYCSLIRPSSESHRGGRVRRQLYQAFRRCSARDWRSCRDVLEIQSGTIYASTGSRTPVPIASTAIGFDFLASITRTGSYQLCCTERVCFGDCELAIR
jgi:hypothetical protein